MVENVQTWNNTCVSGSMLSGMEIWPLFVHSTHRLPEIGIVLEIDILRTSDILKKLNDIKWYIKYIILFVHSTHRLSILESF